MRSFKAYKMPMQNAMINDHFFDVDSCSFQITGMGSKKTAMILTMLIEHAAA